MYNISLFKDEIKLILMMYVKTHPRVNSLSIWCCSSLLQIVESLKKDAMDNLFLHYRNIL